MAQCHGGWWWGVLSPDRHRVGPQPRGQIPPTSRCTAQGRGNGRWSFRWLQGGLCHVPPIPLPCQPLEHWTHLGGVVRGEGALPPAGVARLVLNPPHIHPPRPLPVLVIPQVSGPWDCGGGGTPASQIPANRGQALPSPAHAAFLPGAGCHLVVTPEVSAQAGSEPLHMEHAAENGPGPSSSGPPRCVNGETEAHRAVRNSQGPSGRDRLLTSDPCLLSF